jgi:protein-S-isoprenylcysteine O-methyltransferase Ste14
MIEKRRILPPARLAIMLVVMFVLHLWVPLVTFRNLVLIVSGNLLLLFGLFMTASAAGAFKRAGTPVVPFERSTRLVVDGWYRFTRNPMYLGMALILFGAGIALGSLGALLPTAAFVASIQSHFVEDEETLLTETFGDEYRAYQSRVRRWI